MFPEQEKTHITVLQENWFMVLADEIERGDQDTIIIVCNKEHLEWGKKIVKKIKSKVQLELMIPEESLYSPLASKIVNETVDSVGMAVGIIDAEFTDFQLMSLLAQICWDDGDMRSHCERHSWFDKISHLFIEDEGKNLPSSVVWAVHSMASMRMR